MIPHLELVDGPGERAAEVVLALAVTAGAHGDILVRPHPARVSLPDVTAAAVHFVV